LLPAFIQFVGQIGAAASAIGETIMKKFIVAAACAAMCSASAFAADLPMQTYKSPPCGGSGL
jgi:hypothetical protein